MYGAGKAMGFTFVGFVGSLAAEGVFTYAAHVLNVIPNHRDFFIPSPLPVRRVRA